MELSYNEKLAASLLGRRLREDCLPRLGRDGRVFQFWGEDAGIPESDVHSTQAYRIYVDYNRERVITRVRVQIDGELLSPCSGYAQESLDAFDFPPVLAWCQGQLEE